MGTLSCGSNEAGQLGREATQGLSTTATSVFAEVSALSRVALVQVLLLTLYVHMHTQFRTNATCGD